MVKVVVRRSDIFMAELKGEGTLLQGKHPVLVLSCQVNNKFSDLINILPITSKLGNNPSNVLLGTETGLLHESSIRTNQILTISKSDILFKIGFINLQKMEEVAKVLMEQLGIKNNGGQFKMCQIYEQQRNQIKLAKCQMDFNKMQQLAQEYMKNLYKIGCVIEGEDINSELMWTNYYLALAKKNHGEIASALDTVKIALTYSSEKNSEYYYNIWLLGSICMELGDDYIQEGVKAFDECIEFYDRIGEKKYKTLSIFNKARILKDISGMEECIKTYRNTKFIPMLYSIGDMDKDNVLSSMESELANIL